MARRRITAALRIRVFDRHDGVCHLCGVRIDPLHEPWDVEHVKPLWLDGADDETNMAPEHRGGECHGRKTAEEATVRAKGTRVRARHLGAHKSRRPMAGWRKFDGTPVTNPKLKRQQGGRDDEGDDPGE